MEKAQEFLLEEAMDDLVLSCDSKGEYVYASDMMQKYADQQLILSGVMHRRELLIAFFDSVDDADIDKQRNAEGWKVVDNYLKAIDCA